MYVRVYESVCMHECVCVHVRVCMCACMSVCVHVRVCMCACECMHASYAQAVTYMITTLRF